MHFSMLEEQLLGALHEFSCEDVRVPRKTCALSKTSFVPLGTSSGDWMLVIYYQIPVPYSNHSAQNALQMLGMRLFACNKCNLTVVLRITTLTWGRASTEFGDCLLGPVSFPTLHESTSQEGPSSHVIVFALTCPHCFAEVKEEDIESFHEQYRGSDEEKRDLLQYYEQFKGNMNTVCKPNFREAWNYCHVYNAVCYAKWAHGQRQVMSCKGAMR